MQTTRRRSVMVSEECVNAGISAPCGNALHRTAKPLLLLCLVEIIPLDQCLDIKPRTADDERQISLRRMGADELRHAHDKLRYGKWLIRIQHIDEMMRDTSPLLCGRLCTADVESTIDTHGIARDDVCPQFLGKFQRQRGLSDRRRPEKYKNGAF